MYIAKSNIGGEINLCKIFFDKKEVLAYKETMESFCNAKCEIDEVETPVDVRSRFNK